MEQQKLISFHHLNLQVNFEDLLAFNESSKIALVCECSNSDRARRSSALFYHPWPEKIDWKENYDWIQKKFHCEQVVKRVCSTLSDDFEYFRFFGFVFVRSKREVIKLRPWCGWRVASSRKAVQLLPVCDEHIFGEWRISLPSAFDYKTSKSFSLWKIE